MAEMNDRGQMILLAGVILAVLFVALALLVNAAIYTDNVATRGGDSASEALEYQSGVTDSVGELIDAENADGGHANVSKIETAVEAGTDKIDETHKGYHLRRGAGTNTSLNTTTEGRYLTNESMTGFTDWTANASAVRGFVIDFHTTSMPYDSVFQINLDEVALDIRLNETENQLIVTDEAETIECTVTDPDTVRFDITGQRLGGEPCRFGFPEFNDDRQIGIENGEHAAGTYEVTIESDDSIGTHIPSEIATEAVYSADIDIRIDTPDLSYERTVRVAPGEPDV